MMFYLLSGLEDKKWWQRLVDLERAIERGQIQEAHGAYRDVFRCLVELLPQNGLRTEFYHQENRLYPTLVA